MTKDQKKKWLYRLRHGKIKQAKGRLLREDGSMCCLGVLGRVLGIPDENLRTYSCSIGGTGLEPLDKAFAMSHREHLAQMNDGDKSRGARRRTFKEIAAWISRNL